MSVNKKTLQTVTEKEREIIKLRYQGLKSKEIADKVGGYDPVSIRSLFDKRGRLRKVYFEYSKKMNEIKERKEIKEIEIKTIEMVRASKFVFGKYLNAIKDGKIILSSGDVEKLWKMDRIMRGLPTDISKVEQAGGLKVSADHSILDALGFDKKKFKEEEGID